MPVIFFHPSDDLSMKIEHIFCTHKKSLSEALTQFYLLSVRVSKNNLYIDCNDAGVLFVEALMGCSLSEFAKKPDIMLLDKFLLLRGVSPGADEEAFLVGIHMNVLSFEGIIDRTSGSHEIIDRPTLVAFLRTWAAIARKSPEQVMQADCTAASTLFPSSDMMPSNARMRLGNPFTKQGKSSVRIL